MSSLLKNLSPFKKISSRKDREDSVRRRKRAAPQGRSQSQDRRDDSDPREHGELQRTSVLSSCTTQPPGQRSDDPAHLDINQLFKDALSEYTKQTGEDLATIPLVEEFQSPDLAVKDILVILERQARVFDGVPKGDNTMRLVRRLKPAVGAVLTITEMLGKAASIVSYTRLCAPFEYTAHSYCKALLSRGCDIYCRWHPLTGVYSSLLTNSSDSRTCVQRMSQKLTARWLTFSIPSVKSSSES